jgi:AcrR family transcriptional regulator
MGTRSEQKERRRKQILSAGLDLFVQKGFSDTKVSDIADAANMSAGLLFHYFESKERLYEEIVRIGIEKSESALTFDNSEPFSFLERVAKSILAGLDPFTAKMFVLMSGAADCDALPGETRTRIREGNLLRSEEIIRLGQESGGIRDGEPLALSIAFWGAILGVCRIISQNSDYPRPSYEWILDIIRKQGSVDQ